MTFLLFFIVGCLLVLGVFYILERRKTSLKKPVIQLNEEDPKFKIILNEWYVEARKQTRETLPAFLDHLMNDYEHDYGTICHAMSCGAIATIWTIDHSSQGGITGFQSGAIMWEFLKHWNFRSNKTGLRIIDFDDMLYPQYADQFEKKIRKSTWEALQKEAREFWAKSPDAHPDVIAHWKSIGEGVIPFGYSVSED